MKNLYKDQIRKIRNNLFNFISLSILVIVISLTFTSIKTSVDRLELNYQPYLDEQNVEDFHFTLSSVDIDLLGGTGLWYLCEELELDFECAYYISIGTDAAMTNLNHIVNERIEERPDLVESMIDEYILNVTQEYDFIVEEKWISNVQDGDFKYRFMSLTETIDLPYLVEGTLPAAYNEIAIFPEFAEHNDISINDVINIKGQDYLVTAFVYSPDYAFPIYYLNPMNIKYETIALTHENTIEGLNENIHEIYVGKGDLTQLLNEETYKEVTETDVSTLGRHTQHIKYIKPATANYKIATLPIEVRNGKIFMNTFISIFVLFTGLLLTIFIKRYIDRNKKDIETLNSLGYSRNEITKSLMIFPFLVSMMSFIGYGLGLLVSALMFDGYAEKYLYPKASFGIYPDIFLLSVIVPILFICIISYVFISQNIRNIGKKSIKRITFNIFKFTPGKTILQTSSLLFIVSIMLIFAINTSNIFQKFLDTTRVGNYYEEAIRLTYFTDEEIPDGYESFTRLIANANSVDSKEREFSFILYGIDSDTTLKAVLDDDIVNNALVEDGIIISEYLSYNQNIDVGDEFVFDVEGTEYTYIVSAVSNELIENNAFISKEALNESYLLDNTYYNGLYATDRLYQSENILIRVNYQQALVEIENSLRTSSNIVYLILSLSSIIGLFMLGFIISNYLAENRKNIAILKSIGYNKKEINKKYIYGIIITFVIAFIVAVPATRLVLDLLLRNIISQLGYILILEVTFINIVISFLSLALIFIITLFFVNKFFEKVTITEILKAEEN